MAERNDQFALDKPLKGAFIMTLPLPIPAPISNGMVFQRSEFEIHNLAIALKGTIRATVYEEGGIEPTSIIHVNQSWRIEVEWTLTGGLANLLYGEWQVRVFFESLGPGREFALPVPPATLEMKPCADGGKYKHIFRFPAGTINPQPHESPLYDLGITVIAYDACKKPAPFHGYCRGAALMFVAS